MVELETLSLLTRDLQSCVNAQDWSALQRADATMAETLRRVTPAQKRMSGWSEALAQLREAHGQALQACRHARDLAGAQLQSLASQREVMEAYSLTQDMEMRA